jgi:hypothetical protein
MSTKSSVGYFDFHKINLSVHFYVDGGIPVYLDIKAGRRYLLHRLKMFPCCWLPSYLKYTSKWYKPKKWCSYF